jgi:PII-like signaling protein
VTAAIDGFTHPGDERRRTWLRVGRNAPAVITIVDVEPRVRSFLTDLDDVLDDAVALLEEVQVRPLPDTR